MKRDPVKKFKLTSTFIYMLTRYMEETNLPAWKMAIDINLHPSRISLAINEKPISEIDIERIGRLTGRIKFPHRWYEEIKTKGQPTNNNPASLHGVTEMPDALGVK